jgi:hypothetical protein
MIDTIGTELGASLDSLISEAAECPVSVIDLNRLHRVVYPDGVTEIYLDGDPILELHPMQFHNDFDGTSLTLRVVQPYILRKK